MFFIYIVLAGILIILGLLLRYKYNLEREKARLTAYKKKIENKSDANTTQSTRISTKQAIKIINRKNFFSFYLILFL